MTPAPMLEVLFVAAAGLFAAWVLTYLLHSTLAVAAASLGTRLVRLAAVDRVRIWRFVIVAPFGTATLQALSGRGVSLVTWEVSDFAPQAFVNWRLGLASLVLGAFAAYGLMAGWAAGRSAMQRVFGRRRAAPPELQDEVASLAIAAGCRVPRLTVSATALVPAAVGLREICVPSTLNDSMAVDERRALFAHEVGHLVRRDPIWFALTGSLARVAAFQPLNRFALTRLRTACEEAADDFAVRVTGDPAALARALTGLASVLVLLSAGAAATGSHVFERVSRLLDDDPRAPRSRGRPVRVAVCGAALATLLGLAPGITVSIDDLANRLPWLAPSREIPNARMLEVRRVTREWRARVRRSLR